MKLRKWLFIATLLLLGGTCCFYLFAQQQSAELEQATELRLKTKSVEALNFCKENDYDTDFCILIDMKEHSGKNRLFIYNFSENRIEQKGLCAHGCGKGNKESTGAQPLFSNTEGSWLTSLGKYKIGIRSYSKWGINVHYKLHGLEQSNDNAFKRTVVLHSYTPVSESEIYPLHLPMGFSQGCPVTDNATMRYLDAKLKTTEKPVLLWIYY
jgi:hypothetical protein